MTNTVNTLKNAPGVIAKLAAGMLEDNIVFGKSISKADEADINGKNGYNAGDTIQISKPARFIPTDNADITSGIQGVTEEKVSLALDIRKVVAIELTSAEIATDLALKSWSDRILKPAMSSMAQYLDQVLLERAVDATYNVVGTAGSTTFDTDTVLSARERMNKGLAPRDDKRFALFDSAAGRSAVNARKGLFQDSSDIAEQYRNGLVGRADGFNWLESELLPTVTNGNDVTGVAVESSVLVPATGATQLGVDGLTADTGTVKKGSVFTIAGVYAVHPITKQNLGYLQQFVVTADKTANSSGQATLDISPTIYSSASGSLQNVSALPTDESALVFVGTASSEYLQNLCFHKDAFRMVSVPLVMPDGLDMAAQETYKGFTVRVIRDYTVLTDKLIMRLDFLGGIAAVRPEWSCRITA